MGLERLHAEEEEAQQVKKHRISSDVMKMLKTGSWRLEVIEDKQTVTYILIPNKVRAAA